MNKDPEIKYRIIFESLFRLSGNLSKCNSFESIAQCLRIDMKYILNFNLLRFSFCCPDFTVNYTLYNTECDFEKNTTENLWEQEVLSISKKMPSVVKADNIYTVALQQRNIFLRERPQEIWSWSYNFQRASGIIITLATSETKTFSKPDVPLLKLVVESLYSKLLSLKLIEDLQVKKNELENAVISLKEANETMQNVLNRQDALIEERTAELNEKNSKLLKLSKLNAHIVREPLTRILGILSMIDNCTNEEIKRKWLPMIHISAEDLDKSLNKAIHFVDKQIKRAKKYE